MYDFYDSVISLAKDLCLHAIGMRDKYTHNHCYRVSWLSQKILKGYIEHHTAAGVKFDIEAFGLFGKQNVHKAYSYLELAAHIHDLGKISWKDRHLDGIDLTRDLIEGHPEVGINSLYDSISSRHENLQEFQRNWRELSWLYVILYHHWNYDGVSGYPKTIKNFNLQTFQGMFSSSLEMKPAVHIPDTDPVRVMIGVIRIADSIDAVTSFRPNRSDKSNFYKYTVEDYKDATAWYGIWDEIIQEIKDKSGSIYHPDIVDELSRQAKSLKIAFKWAKDTDANLEEC